MGGADGGEVEEGLERRRHRAELELRGRRRPFRLLHLPPSKKHTLHSISLRFLYEPQKHFRIYLEVAGSNKRSSQKSGRGGCSAPRNGEAGYNYVHPGAPRCPSGSTARAPSPRCAARAAGSRSPRRGLCGDEGAPPFVAAISRTEAHMVPYVIFRRVLKWT